MAWATDCGCRAKSKCKLLIPAYMPEILAAFIHTFKAVKHHGAIIAWVWAIEQLKGVLPVG